MNRVSLKVRAIVMSMAVLGALLLVLMVTMGYALAQQAGVADPEQSALGAVMLDVLKIVFSLLGLVAVALMGKGIIYVERKLKIDIPASYEATLYDWAAKGVGLAQEKSHQQVKNLGKKMKGPEKMEIAIGFVHDMAKQYGWDDLAEKKLRAYIESKLGDGREALPPAGGVE